MVAVSHDLGAYAALTHIQARNNFLASSIQRLSSGNAIVQASDNVAALSVGTRLASNVSTLQQALANTNQGTSLLQVADGALAQINNILTQQKALAVQANSGTLTDTDRSYLDLQFQALSAQIDQIAGATTFGSVNLLDGSLSGAQALTHNTSTGTTAANAANVTTAGAVVTIAGAVTAGNTVTINGYTVTFAASTAGAGTDASAGKVIVGAGVAQTASNLAAFLNNSTDARLANLQFTSSGGAISAVYTGGSLNGNYVVSASTNDSNITVGSSGNRTVSTSGTNLDGLGYGKTIALGSASGSLLVNGDTTATNAGQAINTRAVVNNVDFVGKLGTGEIGSITGTYTAANTAVYALQVGDITYTTAATSTAASASPIALTFVGANSLGAAAGGSFTVNVAGAGYTFSGQSQLDSYVTQLNNGLADVTFAQNRDISSFTPGGTASVSAVTVGTLQGASANLRSDDFSNPTLNSLTIVAPTGGGTDAVFTAVINGETYVSSSGQGNQIATNTTITLQSQSDPNHSFSIVTGNTAISGSTALDLSTQENADAVAAALRTAFGFTGTDAAVKLQIGSNPSDTVGIQIANSDSASLFQNQSLSIGTTLGAQAASTALTTALETVASTRATVGALESRFGYAQANLQSSITSQQAASSGLLDTDIALESTKYAVEQVRLQAGIAVLAQANKLRQDYLKLLD